MINTVTLFGRLTADAEMKGTNSGFAVAKFGLAVNEKRKNKEELTHFIDCTAFGKTAEIIRDYLGKGQPAIIQGRLNQEHWESKNGEKKSKLSVIVENLQLLPKPVSSSGKNRKTEKEETDLEMESEMPF